ncbi:hypothetical protein LTR85_008261 [Meristemomyces frigidus]|nr:hypothetical protein LTR85_008261 [Meristemomyces frigidus]
MATLIDGKEVALAAAYLHLKVDSLRDAIAEADQHEDLVKVVFKGYDEELEELEQEVLEPTKAHTIPSPTVTVDRKKISAMEDLSYRPPTPPSVPAAATQAGRMISTELTATTITPSPVREVHRAYFAGFTPNTVIRRNIPPAPADITVKRPRGRRNLLRYQDKETELHNIQIYRNQEDRSGITKRPASLLDEEVACTWHLQQMKRNGSFVRMSVGEGRMRGWAPELRAAMSPGALSSSVLGHPRAGLEKMKKSLPAT